MQSTEVRLHRLTKHYHHVAAVDHVSLTIPPGNMLALLGPSGCGKTTCLRMIAGLVQPTSGEILVNGKSITKVPVHRRNVGMLFQNYALFPHMTVAENVAFGLRMRSVRKAEIRDRVATALDLVQLGALGARTPAQLSGGQQQRVALARALVIEPAMLLLDEPLGALDKSLREDMQVELRALQQRLGLTTIMVTHDQDEALTMADQVVVMRAGRLEQAGSPGNVYSRPASRFVAGFIGASNFCTGRVERCDSEARVVTPSGLMLRVPDIAQAGLADGAEATVTIRPEAIVLSAPGSDRANLPSSANSPNSIEMTVEQIVYRGFVSHYYLSAQTGERFVAFRQNAGDAPPGFATGDRVCASWAITSSHVLPADHASTGSHPA
jgi:putative spermidine/putrescine transport system ATP-binding protein